MPTKKKAPVRRESTMTTRAYDKANKKTAQAKHSRLGDGTSAQAASKATGKKVTPKAGGMTKKAEAEKKAAVAQANRLKSIAKTEASARRKAKLAGDKSRNTQRRERRNGRVF